MVTPTRSSAPLPLYQPGSSSIGRVAVKMPPFWRNKSSLWFAQLEAQFDLAQITLEKTRFTYVVANLEECYASEVEDIITSPPAVNPYSPIKEQLILRLSSSEEKRIRQLISDEELGDSTPSQFYRRLKSLAGSAIQDSLLKTLWVQRLPSQTQAILQAQSDLSIEKLLSISDKIAEVQMSSSPSTSVCATQFQPGLEKKVEQLALKLEEIQQALRPRRSNSRSRSLSRQRSLKGSCWYHNRFGTRARKCVQPCSFRRSENANSNP